MTRHGTTQVPITMSLRRLFGGNRYRRCKQLFHRPLWSHLRTSVTLPLPLKLQLTSGQTLRVSSARRCRHMFDWLLEVSEDPFPVRLIDGLVEFQHGPNRFALRPSYADFFIFREIMVGDTYGIDSLPKPLGTVVDLGAHIGLFALKVAPVAQRVISVEPTRQNHDMARQLFERMALADKVTLVKAAVTGQSGGTVRIYTSRANFGGHSVFRRHAGQWGGAECEDVSAVSLADLFAQQRVERCSLLKCDVEGAEFDMIAGAPLELLSSIDRILMEVHLTVIDPSNRQLGELVNRLASAGFQVDHGPVRRRWGARRRGVMLWATHHRVAAVRQAA
jgi:FkbM family methyltransferase